MSIKLTSDDTTRVRKLVRCGASAEDIARVLNVDRSTLHKFMRKYGIAGFERHIGTGQEEYR